MFTNATKVLLLIGYLFLLVAVLCLVLSWFFFWFRAKIELFSDMKTIFICTCGHCVLILTLITLTLLLINSALSLADSAADNAQYGNQLTNQFKKAPSFEEDANHYSAAVSSLSGTAASSPNIDSFNSYPPSGSEKSTNDKFADKSSAVNEDDQLNNWDNSYVNSNSANAQQPGPAPPGNPSESDGVGAGSAGSGKDDGVAKPNGPTKVEQPLTKRYMACSRDFGNINNKNKTAGDNGFKIKITGNSEKYTPGELYTSKWVLRPV